MITEFGTDRYETVPDELAQELTKELAPFLIHYLTELPAAAKDVIAQLERMSKAYLFLNPLTWMGVVTQPGYEELHPETPLAVRVAIERLGSQFFYWDAFATEMKASRLGALPSTDKNVLEIPSNKKIQVIQDEKKANKGAAQYSRKEGYGGLITRSNYLGDGDFWDPSIFPMSAQVGGNLYQLTAEFVKISRDTLGVSKELEDKSSRSRDLVFSEFQTLYGEAVTELSSRRAFDPKIQPVITKALSQGADLSGLHPLQMFIYRNYSGDNNNLKELLDSTLNLVAAKVIEKVKVGRTASDLAGATAALAANLNEMWMSARASQE